MKQSGGKTAGWAESQSSLEVTQCTTMLQTLEELYNTIKHLSSAPLDAPLMGLE